MNYPFNSVNDNYNDSYIDQAFHHRPIPNNPPPATFSFSHFPSSIFPCSEVDDDFFPDNFSQHQQPFLETSYFVPEFSTISAHNMIAPPKNNIGDGGASSSSASGESKDKAFQVGKVELADKGLQKRATTTSSKKDRHSKINTAQGPRDRRMRLSLDIARRFFGLQDILGFDKASKTVEWLLNKSKSDIQNLSKVKQIDDPCSPSSECEEVSGLDDDVALKYEDQLGIMVSSISNKKPSPDNKLKEKKMKRPIPSSQRKATLDISGAKESRAKARERARERTKDKMRSRSLHEYKPKSNPHQELSTTQMSSNCWRVPFSSLSLDSMNPSSSLDALAEVGKQVDSFEVNNKLSQFSYPHINWGNYQENPCGDFAFHHKLWEASTSNESSLL